MKNLTKNKIACAVIAVLSSVTSVQSYAADADKESEVEVITVTGIMQSLVAVAKEKKFSNYIKDSIVSEDIGKFPDANVAESLQRISGVSIDRSSGEGKQVTVRGFGPEFNTVLVNGRRMASDSPGRAFNFDTLSSELIGAADVYKTSNVRLQEGGIGSTINLHTQRPLDIGKYKAVVSAKAGYEEKSSDVSPNLFGFISNTFADDTVGVLLSVSHQERSLTQDSAVTATSPTSGRWDQLAVGADELWKFNDNQGNGAGTYLYERQHNFLRTEEERSRTGATAVIQYAPNEDITFTFDALYSYLDAENRSTDRISHHTPPNIQNLIVDENNVVTRYDMMSGPMYVQIGKKRETTVNQFGANLEWNISDSLLATFDLSTSSADLPQGGKNYYIVSRENDHIQRIDNSLGYDAPTLQNFAFNPSDSDLNGDGMVNHLDYTLGNEQIEPDPTKQRSWFAQRNGETYKDDITEVKADFIWELDSELLSNVSFGAVYSKQEKSSVQYNIPKNAGFYIGGRIDLPARLFSVENREDFLAEANGVFQSHSLAFDSEALFDYLESDEALALRDVSIGAAAGTSKAALFGTGFAPLPRLGGSYKVEEEVLSFYVNATHEGSIAEMPLVINAGLRYTSTDVDSRGYAVTFLDFAPVNGEADTLDTTYSDNPEPQDVSTDYSEILPSIDARLDITDNLVARAAFSQTLTRPEMTLLNPAAVAPNILRLSDLNATAGNANLKPTMSDNFDLSLEWYYGETDFITFGYFRKDLDGFIVNKESREGIEIPTPNHLDEITEDRSNIDGDTIFFNITRPRNLETTTVDGFEIGFQHIFSSLPGFLQHVGVNANLTYVDAEDEFDVNKFDDQIALTGLGDSKNIVLFYDDSTIEARIAYNEREEFFTRFQGVEPWFTQAYNQIDARIAYNYSENTQVFLEGTNLSNSFTRQYGRYESQFLSLDSSGRRYALGIRTSF